MLCCQLLEIEMHKLISHAFLSPSGYIVINIIRLQAGDVSFEFHVLCCQLLEIEMHKFISHVFFSRSGKLVNVIRLQAGDVSFDVFAIKIIKLDRIVVGLVEAGRSSIKAKILRAQECTLESPWNTARYSLPTSYMSPNFNKWYPTGKMKKTVSTEGLAYQNVSFS